MSARSMRATSTHSWLDFADDARWVTGQSTIVGSDGLREFFSDAMTGLLPELEIRTMICISDRVACELVERLTRAGVERVFAIAGFYQIDEGRISAAKIYREGSAELR